MYPRQTSQGEMDVDYQKLVGKSELFLQRNPRYFFRGVLFLMPLLAWVKKLNLSGSSNNQQQKSVIEWHLAPSVKINNKSTLCTIPDLGTTTVRCTFLAVLNQKVKNMKCPHFPQISRHIIRPKTRVFLLTSLPLPQRKGYKTANPLPWRRRKRVILRQYLCPHSSHTCHKILVNIFPLCAQLCAQQSDF